MLIILNIILIILIIICVFIYSRARIIDDFAQGCAIVLALLELSILIATFSYLWSVIEGRQLDNKIALYQETNKSIEEKIENAVSSYVGYEKDVFSNIDVNAIVMKYPELKADTLIQQELKVYQENNEKIVKLKEQKIDLNTKKWWLYFGGE